MSGPPEKKFPEKQDNQRKGLDPSGVPDLQVEPQGHCWGLGWNYRDRKLNLGKMHLIPQLLGN